MTLIRLEPLIMLVCSKINIWGGEVVCIRTNTTYTITRTAKLILNTKIQQIKGLDLIGMDHSWIIPTQRWQKITTIKPTINFLGGKVGGPRTHTTFNITGCDTKWITTRRTRWLVLTELWHHVGYYEITLRRPKPHTIPVSAKIDFLGGEVGGTRNNTTSTITINTKRILPPLR